MFPNGPGLLNVVGIEFVTEAFAGLHLRVLDFRVELIDCNDLYRTGEPAGRSPPHSPSLFR